jgi:hypothetical protein
MYVCVCVCVSVCVNHEATLYFSLWSLQMMTIHIRLTTSGPTDWVVVMG